MAVLVIGAGPGLGASLVERFSRDGERLAYVARSADTLEGIARTERLQGRNIKAFQADAADFSSLSRALSQASDWAGPFSVLVYNAVTFNEESAATLSADQLKDDLGATLFGAAQCVQHVLPEMLAQGKGTILTTGGGLSLNPVEPWASVAVGKAGLRAYTTALAKAVGAKGVHAASVTICGHIAPGGDFDPDRIAQSYWDLHMQQPGAFSSELIYSPEGSDKNYNERD
ncbi:SDR family NAD(P)-dependent oxidoreductase [Xinfangfangia sp. CPCC 101601]|uniref:SDR family NAD(P)-dependent oxidoreductase n=1 Tax=Pseudogemmobacter lacusdianii TaxID=3069608 RepID=A0ABU0W3U1_9RHOB|nr:SDR family NAD(P)-dependent oxidoreductase [Xinfangfangia sp. CPCC 101601]MDQ2067740.1 SDR family NAD(P)-dependent oxidoreductase [Xinfangfangia sp. CPCC 101601]